MSGYLSIGYIVFALVFAGLCMRSPVTLRARDGAENIRSGFFHPAIGGISMNGAELFGLMYLCWVLLGGIVGAAIPYIWTAETYATWLTRIAQVVGAICGVIVGYCGAGIFFVIALRLAKWGSIAAIIYALGAYIISGKSGQEIGTDLSRATSVFNVDFIYKKLAAARHEPLRDEKQYRQFATEHFNDIQGLWVGSINLAHVLLTVTQQGIKVEGNENNYFIPVIFLYDGDKRWTIRPVNDPLLQMTWVIGLDEKHNRKFAFVIKHQSGQPQTALQQVTKSEEITKVKRIMAPEVPQGFHGKNAFSIWGYE